MTTVYIGFGSNINPQQNISAAVKMLSEHAQIIAISTIYLTEAFGSDNSPKFFNGILAINTDIPPRKLKFEILRNIENELGRIRTQYKYAPRCIDLDIIVYGDLVLREDDLIIPDPDIYERVFIAVPLLELDSEMILPDTGWRLADVASNFASDTMTALNDFTSALRKEIFNEH